MKDFKEDSVRNMSEKNIEKLKIFMKNPNFEKEKVFNASQAAGNLALWIRAVVDTFFALKMVDPKKRELEFSENMLKDAEEDLKSKKDSLQ